MAITVRSLPWFDSRAVGDDGDGEIARGEAFTLGKSGF